MYHINKYDQMTQYFTAKKNDSIYEEEEMCFVIIKLADTIVDSLKHIAIAIQGSLHLILSDPMRRN